MKRTELALLFFTSLATTGMAHSFEASQGKNEVTIHAGSTIFEGNSAAKNAGLWGLRYGRSIKGPWAVEGSILWGRSELRNGLDNADVLIPTLHGVYQFSNGRLQPFVQAGVGLLKVAPDNNDDFTHAALQMGGGIKWAFTPSILARLEAAYLYDAGTGNGKNNALVLAGVAWRFDNPFGCLTPAPEKQEPEVKEEPKPVETAQVVESTEPAVPKEDQFILKDVRFAFNSTSFDTKSRLHLEVVSGILVNNPSLLMEISGHTDSRGPKTYNQTLSERRAEAAKLFLTNRGVPADRITTRGFGLTRPIASNQTVEGRATNRRVEFKVIRP